LKKTNIGNQGRLKSKKITEKIFNSGRVIYSHDKKLRAHYLLYKSPGKCGIKSSVAVSKKAGKAVWRNRAKRLIREANRLGSYELFENCLNKKTQLEIIFAVNNLNEVANRKISLSDVQLPIEEILKRVNRELIAYSS
jgi:ribonuclease P protein component